jgi:hypothetical protein
VATNGVASLAATDEERARKFTEALWNLAVPSSKVFRYYDGLLYLMSLLHASGRFQVIEPKPRAVNPKATREAQRLLDFLYEIQGKRTMSGQHNFIVSGSRFTDRIHELTGKYPLVWGSDFSFAYQGDAPTRFQHCGPLNLTEPGTKPALTDLTPEAARERLVKNAIQAYRDGHIVTLMWHACPPGIPPTLETLAAQPHWAWFMPWGNLVFWGNGPERIKALFGSDRILTRDQVTRGEDGVYRTKP